MNALTILALVYKLKKSAQDAACYAIRQGILVRPDTCSSCNCECVPHAHHPDYSKPLDVVWLCASCHNRLTSKDNHPWKNSTKRNYSEDAKRSIEMYKYQRTLPRR